ncbi:nuclear transport factor 2 family protein [Pseudaestuariivita sp.]|uniref:nuclear transport factor 2 family protein n=1 Tax=Pseudaestuariivita sp. TaxID=2211669 RepID=UPI004059E8F9
MPDRIAANRATVEAYYAACNGASRDGFRACLAPDFEHHHPSGAVHGPDAEADRWSASVAGSNSHWVIERLLVDETTAVAEWTRYGTGERHRGTEWYAFDDASRIRLIWNHYPEPRASGQAVSELPTFPYAGEGYTTGDPR